MKTVSVEKLSPEAVVKRAFFLAYNACGGALGMGVLQARSDATEDQVWDNIQNSGDYPGNAKDSKPGKAEGDYVFGRMMKLRIEYDEKEIRIPESKPCPDYQDWCKSYESYEELVFAAIKSLDK